METINRETPVENPITKEEIKRIAQVLKRCRGNVNTASFILHISNIALKIMILKHEKLQRALQYWR